MNLVTLKTRVCDHANGRLARSAGARGGLCPSSRRAAPLTGAGEDQVEEAAGLPQHVRPAQEHTTGPHGRNWREERETPVIMSRVDDTWRRCKREAEVLVCLE